MLLGLLWIYSKKVDGKAHLRPRKIIKKATVPNLGRNRHFAPSAARQRSQRICQVDHSAKLGELGGGVVQGSINVEKPRKLVSTKIV